MKGSIIIHVLVMVIGILFLFLGAYIGATDKRQEKLSTHRSLGVLGIVILLLGALGLFITGNARSHLPHFYFGLGSALFFILAAVGGIAFTKAEAAKKQGLFKSHKADAAISMALIVLTIVFGILGIPMLS